MDAAVQDQDDAVLYTAAAAFLVTAAQFIMDPQQTSRKRKKRWDASRSIEERNEYFEPLIPRLRQEDWETHFVYFRMTPPQFDMLLTFIGPRICKHADNDRDLSPSHRLALTLRYLACGTSTRELESEYMVSRSVICAVVPEVCGALWASMQPTYMPVPRMTDWKRISADIHNRLDVPNCVGSLDGKHVNVVRPRQNTCTDSKDKNRFGMVLLAVCDARRCFTIVDVGCNGSSGAGVFNNSEFGWRLREDALNLPGPSSIPGISQPFPHYFVADEVFPLSNNLLRPYPCRDLTTNSRIFNYRISRPRSLIENTFGIIGTRWRILHMPIDALPATVEKIVKTICILHNFLVRNEAEIPPTDRSYCPPSLVDLERPDGTIVPGRWRQYNAAQNCLQPVHRLANNNYARSASQNRDKLRDYFVSDAGALSWQERYVSRGSDDL